MGRRAPTNRKTRGDVRREPLGERDNGSPKGERARLIVVAKAAQSGAAELKHVTVKKAPMTQNPKSEPAIS